MGVHLHIHVPTASHQEGSQLVLSSLLDCICTILRHEIQRLSGLLHQSILKSWTLLSYGDSQSFHHANGYDKLREVQSSFAKPMLEGFEYFDYDFIECHAYAPLFCKSNHF